MNTNVSIPTVEYHIESYGPMFQHGSVATDKTRNVQFEPAMNQNSTTLQPDLNTSNSPSLPPCVYKCAFMRSCQCGLLLASSYKMDITSKISAAVLPPSLGQGIDFLHACLRGFCLHVSMRLQVCLHAFLPMWIAACVNRMNACWPSLF